MGLSGALVFYLLLGASVAIATILADERSRPVEHIFRGITALLFWPLYLPILLQRAQNSAEGHNPSRRDGEQLLDEMAVTIRQVEQELDAAFKNLDGWAENVITRELSRVAELRTAWTAQAARIRELDRLLAETDLSNNSSTEPLANREPRMRRSLETRLENLRRLKELRERLYNDLMGTLAWVRELVTMIHLAKYSGAPASRAAELVAQIAAAVEGLSEVADWRDDILIETPVSQVAAR